MSYAVAPGPPVTKGMTIAVGVGFLALFIAMAGGFSKALIDMVTVHVKAGKRYRFFMKTVPGVAPGDLAQAMNALSQMGAARIDSSNGISETRISYELTATNDKDVVLNSPMVEFGGYKLIPLKIQELS